MIFLSVPCTFPLMCNVPSVWYSCLSPVHSITSVILMYKCMQNQFSVQVYTKPVWETHIIRTSLQYRCGQNQFTVQLCTKTSLQHRCTPNQFSIHMYTEPVYSIAEHKTSLLYRCTQIIYKFTNTLLEQLLRPFEVLVLFILYHFKFDGRCSLLWRLQLDFKILKTCKIHINCQGWKVKKVQKLKMKNDFLVSFSWT